ncbi:pre-mRNA-splicing factor 38B isoform X2 [Gadus morhua]|uniref:Pre-mRNA-splicing factor 38B n=2 Tax=Gadus morhua TaxID=8049 RepID=A0A8C4ZFI3_GADMO|nr:pre-mRNA-splicing factor 38B isoform X2 [Gadus morhua]
MANVGNQQQAINKTAPGKHGNVLPLWGNEKTMNLNPMILTNVLSSPYFKVQLYELKTYHEVVDEIYFKVNHVEPWEKGSRKTAGQTGMCGGVRGVGTGGIVSTAFCLLYKLFTLKMTRKQVMGLITHTDSPYIRALGFMYIRYTQPPPDLVDWYDGFLDDEEELDVKAGGGCMMSVGEMLRSFLTKLEWFSTLFPRIPVPVQKMIDQQMKARPRKIVAKEPEAEAEATPVEPARSPRRTPTPRRSPKPSRSPSRHGERERHGPSFDRELERERDRQRKEKEGRGDRDRERGGGGVGSGGERRRSRSDDRNRERRRSPSGSREKRGERRDKERDGGAVENDRSKRKDREHHKDRSGDGERSRDKKSRGEPDDRRHKEERDRHREERKAKRATRSRSREKRHKSSRTEGGGEEKSRKREHSREREPRSHKQSGSKEKSHRHKESSNNHGKHGDRRRSHSNDKMSS